MSISRWGRILVEGRTRSRPKRILIEAVKKDVVLAN